MPVTSTASDCRRAIPFLQQVHAPFPDHPLLRFLFFSLFSWFSSFPPALSKNLPSLRVNASHPQFSLFPQSFFSSFPRHTLFLRVLSSLAPHFPFFQQVGLSFSVCIKICLFPFLLNPLDIAFFPTSNQNAVGTNVKRRILTLCPSFQPDFLFRSSFGSSTVFFFRTFPSFPHTALEGSFQFFGNPVSSRSRVPCPVTHFSHGDTGTTACARNAKF